VRPAIDDRVLDAVARLLTRGGLAAATMTAIADEAGTSRVTLHRRGLSIDDYVVAALGRASDELRAELWPVLTGPGDAATRLTTALTVLCAVVERHAGVMAAFYRKPPRPLPTDPGRPERTTSIEFIEPFERLLTDGTIDGSLASTDPKHDATLVANAVCWTYLHMREAHRWPGPATAEQIVAMATAHLRTRGQGTTDTDPDTSADTDTAGHG
jgi:AcrR family transcriptional regulator